MKSKIHWKNMNNDRINQRYTEKNWITIEWIKDPFASISNSSNDYFKKHMKIKLFSDNDLSLNETLKLYNRIIAVRSAFHKGNKYYPQVFLAECLYKL